MKKLCLLLALLLLLTGCSPAPDSTDTTPPATTVAAEAAADSALVRFDIYVVNDLHGRLTDTDMQPGVDELSTYLKLARQSGNTILLSTGDMWQGGAEANLTGGLIVTEWMNELGFDAMTIGGHEYDWGEAGIRQNDELAEFPFLGINIYSRLTNRRPTYCESSLTVELDGVQIGIIGAIGDCSGSVAAENIKDVCFKTGDELTELVKAEAEKLRSEGADFIIYTVHDGGTQTTDGMEPAPADQEELRSYYDTALSDGYVDLVFEADSHYWYSLEDQQGVYHLQAGGNNQGLSHATVLIDKATGTADILTAELLPASKYASMAADPIVEQLLQKYDEQVAPAAQILGTNSQYKNNTMLGDLVAKLYRDSGLEKWGDEYDIVLGGGYIFCRSPGYLSAGQVSYGQLMSLLPFDNEITLCSIRGSDLLSRFLENDHYAYHISTTAYGDSIRGSIDPDATYYVVTDSYSACYAPNNMTVIDIYSEDIFARDLLADYIAAGGLG